MCTCGSWNYFLLAVICQNAKNSSNINTTLENNGCKTNCKTDNDVCQDGNTVEKKYRITNPGEKSIASADCVSLSHHYKVEIS